MFNFFEQFFCPAAPERPHNPNRGPTPSPEPFHPNRGDHPIPMASPGNHPIPMVVDPADRKRPREWCCEPTGFSPDAKK